MPTEELRLVVTTAEWEPHFDLVAATEAAHLTAKATQIGDRNTVLIPVDIDDPDGERNLSRIATNGRWPIEAPATLPLDATVKRGLGLCPTSVAGQRPAPPPSSAPRQAHRLLEQLRPAVAQPGNSKRRYGHPLGHVLLPSWVRRSRV